MLDKFIFFVSKQLMLIEISDIPHVAFSRVSADDTLVRTFDMQIITKHGSEYTFTSINKEGHELTDTSLKDKKVHYFLFFIFFYFYFSSRQWMDSSGKE